MQAGDWWIGWIEEIPGVNCQEGTHDELFETLRLTLREAIEFNRNEIDDHLAQKICKDLGIKQIK